MFYVKNWDRFCAENKGSLLFFSYARLAKLICGVEVQYSQYSNYAVGGFCEISLIPFGEIKLLKTE